MQHRRRGRDQSDQFCRASDSKHEIQPLQDAVANSRLYPVHDRSALLLVHVPAQTFGPARAPGATLTDRERDIAASLQLRLEEVGFHVLNHLHDKTGLTDLGLAGGVAYNSVMNGKILLNTPFKRLFIQPAAGDSGTALGVCYQIYNGILKHERGDVMSGAYTGPEFSDEEIRAALQQAELPFETHSDEEVTRRAAH